MNPPWFILTFEAALVDAPQFAYFISNDPYFAGFVHLTFLGPVFLDFGLLDLHWAIVGLQAGYLSRFSPFLRPQGLPVLQSTQPFPSFCPNHLASPPLAYPFALSEVVTRPPPAA